MNHSYGNASASPVRRPSFTRRTLAASIVVAFGSAAPAAWPQLPSGAEIVNGSASITADETVMTIRNSPNAVLNWQSFSIGAQNTVRFEQANASSKVLNRVVGNDPSSIFGSLSSNGEVWLVNPHGVLFGSDARIDVGGLVASTLGIANQDFLGGRHAFGGDGVPGGPVLNQGEITTSFGGHVWLLGGVVRNEGMVRSDAGQVVLAAGKSIELVDSGMPNIAVRVSAPENETVNLGSLLAPGGGSIDLHGAIVNQNGIVRADSLYTEPSGRVIIRAQGDVHLGASSQTSVSTDSAATAGRLLVESTDGAVFIQGRVSATNSQGIGGQIHVSGTDVDISGETVLDASGATGGGEVLIGGGAGGANPALRNALNTHVAQWTSIRANATKSGDGGRIVVRSDGATRVFGNLDASGGQYGGKGGQIETSGDLLEARPGLVDVYGTEGDGGMWTLGSSNITVIADCCTNGDSPVGTDDPHVAQSDSDTALVYTGTIGAALARGANVRLQAGGHGSTPTLGNIVVAADIRADGDAVPGRSLTLQADQDIVINAGVGIVSGHSTVPVTMIADADGNGVGGIRLQEGARIETGGGKLRMAGGVGGDGRAQHIVMQHNAIEAGSGSIAMAAESVELTGAGLFGSEVAIAGRGVGLNDTQITARAHEAPGGIAIDADTVTLAGGALTASSAGGINPSLIPGIRISAGQVGLAGTHLDAAGDIAITGASSLALGNAVLSSASSGDAIKLSSANLAATSSTLSTPNGRWLVYLDGGLASFPSAALGELGYTFVQVNRRANPAPIPSGIGQHGVIVADPLDVRMKVNAARDYDGTVRAAFSEALADNLAPGFALRARTSAQPVEGAFQDKNAGVDKAIGYAGSEPLFGVVTVTGQPVYGASLTYVGDITPKTITPSGLVAANKVYDASRTATLSGIPSGIVAGDSVDPVGATGLFDTKDAGVGKRVTISGGTLAGVDAGNYRLAGSASALADIAQRTIGGTSLVAADKVYDGTRGATLSGVLAEALPGDIVSLDGATALFDSRKVGANKLVAIQGGVLTGVDAGNYILAPSLTTNAAITHRPVDIVMTGEVRKQYDATTTASLARDGFFLNGVLPDDAVTIAGPVLGNFDSPDVGQRKQVTASGTFAIDGADAANYRVGTIALTASFNLVNASVSAKVATILPATLVYQAAPALRDSGAPAGDLTGSVTGFKGSDGIASATTGALQWQSLATPASLPGTYAINGSGLTAVNYVFVQAPGNATALEIRPAAAPPNPPQPQPQPQPVQEHNAVAINAAVRSALPAMDLRASGGVFDRSSPGVARTFGAVPIASMNQDELVQMLARRKDFKRSLFADAIYKLDIDPSLADVQPCTTVAEASSGACRLTPPSSNWCTLPGRRPPQRQLACPPGMRACRRSNARSLSCSALTITPTRTSPNSKTRYRTSTRSRTCLPTGSATRCAWCAIRPRRTSFAP